MILATLFLTPSASEWHPSSLSLWGPFFQLSGVLELWLGKHQRSWAKLHVQTSVVLQGRQEVKDAGQRTERPHITLLSSNVPCASGAAPWISVVSHHSGTARSSGVPSTAASSDLSALLAYRNSSLSLHLSPCRDILKYISQGPGGSGPQSRVASGLFWWHRHSVHEELKQLPRDTNSIGHICKLIKSQVTESLSGPTFKAPPANLVLPPPGD